MDNNLLEDKKTRFIFDHMVEEVHYWQLIRNDNGTIKAWKLIYLNPPALKTWGFKALTDLEGKSADEIFGEGATEHYIPIVNKIFTDNKPYTYEDYFPHLDKYFRFTSVPLGNYFITTGFDITQTVKENKKLSSDNQLLESLVAQRTEELQKKIVELELAIKEVKTLQDLIPICSYCKKIRDDMGSWQQLEAYFHSKSELKFSHGICPDCAEEHFNLSKRR